MEKICDKCFIKYNTEDKRQKYCSKKCSILAHSREGHPMWKDNNIGYGGIHDWLQDNFPKPEKCENCGKRGEKNNGKWNIEWAKLKNKEYERKRENFWKLCHKCHSKYDGLGNKKGHIFSEETKRKIGEANKISLLGKIPWNKGMKFPYKPRSNQKRIKLLIT